VNSDANRQPPTANRQPPTANRQPAGSAIAHFGVMARRIAALVGIVALVVLATTLLWQVYLHHAEDDPDRGDEPATVHLKRGVEMPIPAVEKFAAVLG
jgi:hypothetical protein